MASNNAAAHEIVGEVTPLMLHMNHALTFARNGKEDKAIKMAQEVYADFQVPMRAGKEQGLDTNSKRVDRVLGTSSNAMIAVSLKKQDFKGLIKGVELLSFLLMLEKFDTLQASFKQGNPNLSAQKTIFWLARNYFSYLLEPHVAQKDPIEEKRLDRLLDRMLYRLEDHEWEQFIQLREDLVKGMVLFFKFPIKKH